jgi:starvation-inducible DNA-binding protein
MTTKSSSATAASSASTAIMEQDIKTDIGVKDDARKKLVEMLNMRLCDEYVLYTKTRKYHWNVIGPRFHQLHEFFKEQNPR